MKLIPLNECYSCFISSDKRDGFIQMKELKSMDNIESFGKYVIQVDQGPRFATRYIYSTNEARSRKAYFWCDNPFAAIQQAILPHLKNIQWPEVYIMFKEIKNKKYIATEDAESGEDE